MIHKNQMKRDQMNNENHIVSKSNLGNLFFFLQKLPVILLSFHFLLFELQYNKNVETLEISVETFCIRNGNQSIRHMAVSSHCIFV